MYLKISFYSPRVALFFVSLLCPILFFVSSPTVLFAETAFTFIDRDGDLLCDSPLDQKELRDPDVLYYTSSPEGGRRNDKPNSPRHERLIASIAQKTGKKVEWLPVSSSVEEIQLMRDGKLHIAGFSTGTTGFAVNLAGFIPFVVKTDRQTKGEMLGYRLQVIVNSKSSYHSLYDLRGEVIAHTSSTSNSGNLAPRALLPDFGLIPDSTYQVVYSGKHKKSILGVVDGTYPAAAVASSILNTMISDGTVVAEDIRILYSSPKFPTLSMGYVYNLSPELIEQIQQVFLDYTRTPLPEETEKAKGYIPISYKNDWDIVRHIAKFSGYSYTEDGLASMLAKKKK